MHKQVVGTHGLGLFTYETSLWRESLDSPFIVERPLDLLLIESFRRASSTPSKCLRLLNLFPLFFKWLVSLSRQVNQLSKQRISKMLLSICSLFTSMSLRLAVICSNVLANGCYQFAVYSIHWCSNGAINLQLSATMYSQTVDTVPCNNALANGCYKFAAYWLPILSQQMGDVD